MKKIFIALMMAASTTCFAATNDKQNNNEGNNVFTEIANTVKSAPSGTYGVSEVTRDHIVISTPFGRHTIEKKNGTYSFMGMTARVTSVKNGVYKVKTSIGNFTINTKKMTVTKE